ncbi:MAG: hypothetical protein DHS20C14_01520 [Phycisphaeraceae bacterium]|nr:MAG: hypothetical protein DHS20C14_01520 [Phycisphaeraceae bacterium]
MATRCSTLALPIAALALAGTASADLFHDDFESYTNGALPGGEWHDIFERAVDRPVPSPSMTVIDTTDAHGNATKAMQSSVVKGTNGAFVPIAHAKTHTVSMDVRIDQLAAPGQGWPAGVGFIKDLGDPSVDVNRNPQAILYGWTDRRWRFFATQSNGTPNKDDQLSGPRFVLGTWYRLTVTVDTEIGLLQATVADAATGQIRNTGSHSFTNWDVENGMFDAFTMFDGESENSTTVGQATVDNVTYTPAPGAATAILTLALGAGARRRRR